MIKGSWSKLMAYLMPQSLCCIYAHTLTSSLGFNSPVTGELLSPTVLAACIPLQQDSTISKDFLHGVQIQ